MFTIIIAVLIFSLQKLLQHYQRIYGHANKGCCCCFCVAVFVLVAMKRKINGQLSFFDIYRDPLLYTITESFPRISEVTDSWDYLP